MERAPGVGEHRALSIIPSSPEPAAVNGPELVSALYNNDMNLKLKKISAKQARKAEAQRAQHLPPPHRHHDKEEDLQLRSQWSRLLDEYRGASCDLDGFTAELLTMDEKQSRSLSDRIPAVIERHVYMNMRKGICPKCWLLKRCCICSRTVAVSTHHKVYVWMHYTEFLRASNSGKLALRAIPGCRLLLYGIKSHDESLRRLLDNERDRTALLFPSSASISLQTFLARFAGCNDPLADPRRAAATGSDSSFNIVLVDGTWSQASQMYNSFVDKQFPCVKLEIQGPSLFQKLRKQVRTEGYSTIEALIALFEQLGDLKLSAQLTSNLKVMVDAVEIQKNRSQQYASFSETDESTMRVATPPNPASRSQQKKRARLALSASPSVATSHSQGEPSNDS